MAERQILNPQFALSSPSSRFFPSFRERTLEAIVMFVLGLAVVLATILLLPMAIIVALYVNANDMMRGSSKSVPMARKYG